MLFALFATACLFPLGYLLGKNVDVVGAREVPVVQPREVGGAHVAVSLAAVVQLDVADGVGDGTAQEGAENTEDTKYHLQDPH